MKICTCMWIWRYLPHIQILWSFGSFPHLKGDNIKESYYPDNLSIPSEGLHLVLKGEWELWIRYPWMSSGQWNADCISKELCIEREVAHTQIKTIKTPLHKYSNETPSVFTGFLFSLFRICSNMALLPHCSVRLPNFICPLETCFTHEPYPKDKPTATVRCRLLCSCITKHNATPLSLYPFPNIFGTGWISSRTLHV